jgi:DNA-binding CsgD family transcriptional regulator
VFYILDSRTVGCDVHIFLTGSSSVAVIDFSHDRPSDMSGNIIRLNASEPRESLVSHLLSVSYKKNETTRASNRRNIILSEDERDVLTLFTAGYSVKETAELCGIPIQKVYTIKRTIRLRLGFKNCNQLYLSVKRSQPLFHDLSALSLPDKAF